MNIMMKKMSVAVVLISGVMGSALAAPVSDVITGYNYLMIGDVGTASVTLTPETDLWAGVNPAGTLLAKGKATVTSGTVAYRITPGSFDKNTTAGSNYYNFIVRGKNTGSPLRAVLSADPYGKDQRGGIGNGYSDNNYPVDFPGYDMDSGWFVSTSGSSTNFLIKTESGSYGNQTVAADSYLLSVDAAVWLD